MVPLFSQVLGRNDREFPTCAQKVDASVNAQRLMPLSSTRLNGSKGNPAGEKTVLHVSVLTLLQLPIPCGADPRLHFAHVTSRIRARLDPVKTGQDNRSLSRR